VRKWALWTLTAGVLAASFFIMSATALLKQSFGPDDDVPAGIEALEQAVDRLEWNEAESAHRGLESAWERVRRRVQFVAEKDDIVRMRRTIDELRGSIAAQDRATAKVQIESLKSIWRGMR